MKKLLTPDQQDILRKRVELARGSNLFSLRNLQNGWLMTQISILRYTDEHYRLQSQIYARSYERGKQQSMDRSLCQICFMPLKGHERCPICSQLIHEYSRHTH